jgi:hypothetical protein
MKMSDESDYGENGECLHLFWDIDRTNFGKCCVCKEERQFSDNGNSWEVVRPGVPRRPETNDNSIIHEYYVTNREAIVRDYFELGLPVMLKRWKISKGTWWGLKKGWIYKGLLCQKTPTADDKEEIVSKTKNEGTYSKEAVLVIVSVKLPPFPEMKDDWPLSLKEKWFESYNNILKTSKPEETSDARL